MRFRSGYFVALVTALASTQQIIQILSNLPLCAQQCIVDELGKLGCFAQNLTCSCPQKALITKEAGPCVVANCTTAQVQETVNITNQVCDIFASRVSSSIASVARTHTSSATSLPISLSTTLATITSSSQSTASSAASGTLHPASKTGLSTGAKAGIGVGASILGLLILTAIAVCVIGARRRGQDLKHLAWIERRGTVRGRSELEVTQPEMVKEGGREGDIPPVPALPVAAVLSDRYAREDRGRDGPERDDGSVGTEQSSRRDGDTLGTGTGTMSDIVSPVSPMERERSTGFRAPGERSAII